MTQFTQITVALTLTLGLMACSPKEEKDSFEKVGETIDKNLKEAETSIEKNVEKLDRKLDETTHKMKEEGEEAIEKAKDKIEEKTDQY